MKSPLSILIILVILTAPFYCRAGETVLLTNGEWPPFMSEELEHYGLISHIVKEAFALEGVRVEYKFHPWPKAFELVRSGHMEGSIVYSRTPERAEFVFFSNEAVWEGSWIFYHLKSFQFHWETFNDFTGIEIGATRGFDYGRRFQNALRKEKLSVQWVSNDELNFEKLLQETIQVFINDPQVTLYQMRKSLPQEEIDRITWHPLKFHRRKFYLIMSKKYIRSRYLIDLFDKGMRQLHINGQFDQFVTDFQNGKYEK